MTIIYLNNKVRYVFPRVGTVPIRHIKSQPLVLDVCSHSGMRFHNSTKLGFPVAVQDRPIDMTFARISLPATGLGSVEIYVHAGTSGVIRVKHGTDRLLALEAARDPVMD